jgi:hypothetical protein
MKIYGEIEISIHIFLISVLDGSDQFHALAALSPEKSP